MNTHGRTRMAAEWSRFQPVSCVFMWKMCLPLTAGDLATTVPVGDTRADTICMNEHAPWAGSIGSVSILHTAMNDLFETRR